MLKSDRLEWTAEDWVAFAAVTMVLVLVLLLAMSIGGQDRGEIGAGCLSGGRCNPGLECREWRERGDWRCVPPRGVP